jgi:hypothetical protein
VKSRFRSLTAARPPFWVDGTVTHVGERISGSEDTTVFRSLDICRLGGSVQRLTVVCALRGVAALIEQSCIGTFFFWQETDECRLWCVARADGPNGLDVDTMRKIIPAFDAERIADAR